MAVMHAITSSCSGHSAWQRLTPRLPGLTHPSQCQSSPSLYPTSGRWAPAAEEQSAAQSPGVPASMVNSTLIVMQPPSKQPSVPFPSAVEQVSSRTACLDAS